MALRTITVRELIDLLEGEDEQALVIFTADYGDHYHTAQALPLRGECEAVTIEKSAYSNSGFAIEDERDADAQNDDDVDTTYLVIR